MKIERISDTQIKFTFSKADLVDRNIKLEELIVPSEKTQGLFRDIMAQAFDECDFDIENTPIMIEAFPVGSDGVMIVVTKVDNSNVNEHASKLAANLKDTHKYKRKPISQSIKEDSTSDHISIYSFKSLDDIIDCAKRIRHFSNIDSQVYKLDNKYFFVLQQNSDDLEDISTDDMDLILNEYGEKHISSLISKYYLKEHGEAIIESFAVERLSNYF